MVNIAQMHSTTQPSKDITAATKNSSEEELVRSLPDLITTQIYVFLNKYFYNIPEPQKYSGQALVKHEL